MTDSYIMIDPHGRFYQNTNGTYSYSKSILDITENEIIKYENVDMNKYNKRKKIKQNIKQKYMKINLAILCIHSKKHTNY